MYEAACAFFNHSLTASGPNFFPSVFPNIDWNSEKFGTVTGRQRRAAPFNFELAKKACIINSATQIALTKLDILYPQTAGISDFSKLDNQSSQFIKKIEEETGVPVTLIGTGANENHIIDRRR